MADGADAQQTHRNNLPGFYVSMWAEPALAAAVAVAMWRTGNDTILIAVPVLAIWLLAPAAAWWLSLPAQVDVPRLSGEERAFLRLLARRTWRFFETFVGEADNWLPPDNYQEEPAARGGASDIADQHWVVAAGESDGERFWVYSGGEDDRADKIGAGDDGPAAAVSEPLLQLV